MITISPHATNFLEKIDSSAPALALINYLINNLTSDVEIHFTGSANGSDLRVRAFRITMSGIKEGRNIFTMYWRPTKNNFLCRILSDIDVVVGGCVSDVRRVNESVPLPVEFSLSPTASSNDEPAGPWLVNEIESKVKKFVAFC